MRKEFYIKRHEDFDILGLIEKGAPAEFEPLTGMGTAHDCLEHFPGDDGSIDHEFMALGCALWLRGMGGYFINQPAEVNISSEMSSLLWRLYSTEDYVMREPKLGNRLQLNDMITETIKLARQEILSEAKSCGDEVNLQELQRFIESGSYWLQVGYNRGEKRYSYPGKVCYLFQQIENGVDKILKYAEEGQEVEIQYCVTRCTAHVKELELEEYY